VNDEVNVEKQPDPPQVNNSKTAWTSVLDEHHSPRANELRKCTHHGRSLHILHVIRRAQSYRASPLIKADHASQPCFRMLPIAMRRRHSLPLTTNQNSHHLHSLPCFFLLCPCPASLSMELSYEAREKVCARSRMRVPHARRPAVSRVAN
jgi:hypothetical protein